MTQRVHPMTAVLVVAIVLVGVMLGYSRMASMTPRPDAEVDLQGSPVEDEDLGIAWVPDAATHGYSVSRILPGPAGSRLALVGVKRADVLMGLNETGTRLELNELRVALNQLEKMGKPFSLTVKRAGEEVVLRPTKLPKLAGKERAPRSEAAGGSCADGGSCALGGSGSCADGGSCALEEGGARLKKRTANKPEPVIGK